MVSFIIINYNGNEFIKKCLESIIQLNLEKEIIVVDNNSTDDSTKTILKYPVRLIKMKKNLGYPKALNIGIKNSKGDFLFLLTPTTYLSKDIDFKKLKDYDVATIKLVDMSNMIIKSIRNIPRAIDFFFLLTGISNIFYKSYFFNRWRNPKIDYEKKNIVEQPMSCALFLKRNIIEKIGLFDEIFFLYFSDVDFSKRAKENNIITYYIPDYKAIHITGGITYKLGDKRLYYFYKDLLRYVRKHHKLSYPIFLILSLISFHLKRKFKI